MTDKNMQIRNQFGHSFQLMDNGNIKITFILTIQILYRTPFVLWPLLHLQKPFYQKKYGGRYTVTLIPGDGAGQEITDSVKQIFKSQNVPIDWEVVEVSGVESETGKSHGVDEAVESLKRNKVGLKGILYTSTGKSAKSLNVALRKELDIYASLVLIKNIPGVKGIYDGIDFCLGQRKHRR